MSDSGGIRGSQYLAEPSLWEREIQSARHSSASPSSSVEQPPMTAFSALREERPEQTLTSGKPVEPLARCNATAAAPRWWAGPRLAASSAARTRFVFDRRRPLAVRARQEPGVERPLKSVTVAAV